MIMDTTEITHEYGNWFKPRKSVKLNTETGKKIPLEITHVYGN